MKLPIFLSLALALSWGACSSDKKPEEAQVEDGSHADWQLPGDASFYATITPWPAKAGPASLELRVTPDDAEQKFTGAIAVRVASTAESSDPWIPVPKLAESPDGNVHFAVPITLPSGEVTVRFQVKDSSGKDVADLNDWKIKVE